MINKVKEHFDDFSIAGRIFPAVTVCLPILFIAIHAGLLEDDWFEASVTFAITAVLIGFASHIVRELGKSYEEKMFKKLNGMPTTIIMRYSDNRIDNVTKQRYHQWLSKNVEGQQLPLSLEDEKKDEQSDSKYASAMTFLRVYANSHREELQRVYQELKKYNFWRNLYGCKWYALGLYLIILVREFVIIDRFDLRQMFATPFPKYGVLLGMIIWFIVFCFVVTQKTVERNSFDYAKALLETVDLLSQRSNTSL